MNNNIGVEITFPSLLLSSCPVQLGGKGSKLCEKFLRFAERRINASPGSLDIVRSLHPSLNLEAPKPCKYLRIIVNHVPSHS